MVDLRPYLKPLAITAAVALVWVGGYQHGHKAASQAAAVELQAVQLAHANERAEAAEKAGSDLAAALAEQQTLSDQAQQIGWELIQARAELANTQRQLKQRIADATRQDGPGFTGLGPDSLRLYRAALGYPERDPGVPATDAGNAADAGQAGTAESGLPPDDLLAHAGDYGQWCQQLEAGLSAFIRLHQERP
ncbi:hypothetical protein OL229_09115 [Neisseriaceae bacterium JH1-16]|nr:hypothetical protein [Neisseriaceae bacterium JH1-16]